MRTSIGSAGRLASLARAFVLIALVAGCAKKSNPVAPGGPGPPIAGAVPDFSLPDVNTHSATYGQAISPRQMIGKVSAWYFGHST